MTSLELYIVLLKDIKNVTKLSILRDLQHELFCIFITHRSTHARAFIVLKRLLFLRVLGSVVTMQCWDYTDQSRTCVPLGGFVVFVPQEVVVYFGSGSCSRP